MLSCTAAGGDQECETKTPIDDLEKDMPDMLVFTVEAPESNVNNIKLDFIQQYYTSK